GRWTPLAHRRIACGRSIYEDSTVTPSTPSPQPPAQPGASAADAARDLADVSAAQPITTVGVHLLSAAALRCGLAEEGPELEDRGEGRIIVNARAGLVTAAGPELGGPHARARRGGLRSVPLACRGASSVTDAPGGGRGAGYPGAVR